jgi:all-trans-8'-apo-beta-carotenal 15,15'-oxygenase
VTSLNRRHFLRQLGVLSALSALDPFQLAFANLKGGFMSASRLSVLANRNAEFEGEAQLRNIEGQIPLDLMGQLLRNGPGQKEAYGTALKHFFDGDAYLSGFTFKDGRAYLRSRFINTPERSLEKIHKKRFYHEHGTPAPEDIAEGYKNPPNISVLPWQKDLLTFSESDLPVLVSQNFDYKEKWNASGQLPENITVSAHPKVDPDTGFIYGFGYTKNLLRALTVFRMDPWTGEVKVLWSLPQNQVYMIHDMAITKEHIVFMIPSIYFKMMDLAMAKAPLSQSLVYSEELPTRILAIRKDGEGMPQEVNLPPSMVFHHANAYIENDILTMDSFIAKDASFFEVMDDWEQLPREQKVLPALHRVQVDLKMKKLLTKTKLHERCDFPTFNEDYRGQKNRYMYFMELLNPNDPLGFTNVTKFDLETNKYERIELRSGEICGEPVFVPRIPSTKEDDGYILFMGYNHERDESYVEIRKSQDMSFLARIWADRYLPLGFHGAFQRIG